MIKLVNLSIKNLLKLKFSGLENNTTSPFKWDSSFLLSFFTRVKILHPGLHLHHKISSTNWKFQPDEFFNRFLNMFFFEFDLIFQLIYVAWCNLHPISFSQPKRLSVVNIPRRFSMFLWIYVVILKYLTKSDDFFKIL